MEFVILGILFIIGLIIFCLFLSKNNFDLHGCEVVIAQISFLFLFHIGNYQDINYYHVIISAYFLILLILYYLIRLIKKQKYIEAKIISFYFLLTIINIISLISLSSIDSTYRLIAYILYPIYSGLIIAYILFINLICFVINLVKRNKVKENDNGEENNKNNFEQKFIFISMIFPIIYGLVGSGIYHIVENNKKDYLEKEAITYLTNKYGDGNFEVIDISLGNICFNCSVFNEIRGYLLTITTNYFEGEFILTFTRDTYEIRSEDFIFNYFSSFKEDFVEKTNQEMMEKYNAKLNFFFDFNTQDIENYLHEPLESQEFKDLLDIDLDIVTINKTFKEDEIEEFKTYILELYNAIFTIIKKNDVENTMYFNFAYSNPFSNKEFSTSDGYIKETETEYLIYVNPTPIRINK